MQPDPVLVEDTRAWFRRVAVDLRSAEAALAATPPVLEDLVFNCQQAAEKAMKGFLTWHQSEFGKTHDLRELGSACSQLDAVLGPLMERAMPLTRHAWEFRYPGDQEEPSQEEARQALALAREVLGRCWTVCWVKRGLDHASLCPLCLSSSTRLTVLPFEMQQGLCARGAQPPCQGLNGEFF